MKLVRSLLALAILICLLPIGSVMLASWLAESHGCVLNEGNPNPCLIGGVDWADTLYAMFVSGWFMLATVPIGAVLVVSWIVVEIVNLVKRRRARAQA